MFDLLNILYTVVALVPNLNLYAVDEVPYPKLGTVAAIQFRESGYDKCRYKGLIVPYVRDWDEEKVNRDGTVTIIKATPDTLEAYAIVLNRKECPDKTPVNMLLADEVRQAAPWVKKVVESKRIFAINMENKKPEMQPKWLGQVFNTIENNVEISNDAKLFVEQMAARKAEELAKQAQATE